MALIQCADCGQEISDAAANCPKCGAPTPRSLEPEPGMEACPFCMTAVHENSLVCPGCRAQKAYAHAGGRMYGKVATIFWGIVFPLAVTALFPPIGLVFVPIALFCLYRLIRGPVWYQRREI